ncbi:Sir2 family NAD-dependent protein deacetylase [Anaerosinus sp.]
MEITRNLVELINKSKYPICYTGPKMFSAKINDINAFWGNNHLINLLNLENFKNKNQNFFQICNELINKARNLSPTKNHFILKDLGIPIITENIDGLHKKSGSQFVVELHGNITELKCTQCEYKINVLEKNINLFSICPKCHTENLRPDIVLKGEPLKDFHLALEELYKADLLIVLGHDPKNWPACRLIIQAKKLTDCRSIFL